MTLGFSLHRKIPCGKVEAGGDCEAADAVMVSAINEGGSQPAPPLGSRLKNPLKVALAAMIRGKFVFLGYLFLAQFLITGRGRWIRSQVWTLAVDCANNLARIPHPSFHLFTKEAWMDIYSQRGYVIIDFGHTGTEMEGLQDRLCRF